MRIRFSALQHPGKEYTSDTEREAALSPLRQKMALQNRLAKVNEVFPNRQLRIKTLQNKFTNKKTKPFNTHLFNTPTWVNFVKKFILDNNRAPHNVSANGVDLSGTNLPRVNLSGARLKHANLSHIMMMYANLSNADLQNSKIRHTTLHKANLQNANLSNADLENLKLNKSYMMRANLNNANLHHADLTQVNLSNANLRNAVVTQAKLINADLFQTNCYKANFSYANLSNAWLVLTNFNRANLKNTCLLNVTANNMKARRANFSVTDRTNFHYGNYALSGDLRDAKLTGAVFHGRNLIDITLSYAKLRGAKLGNKTKLIGNQNVATTIGQWNRVDLTNADLKKARINNTQLAAVDMTDAKTEGLVFKNVKVYSDSKVPPVSVPGSDVKTDVPRSQWLDQTF